MTIKQNVDVEKLEGFRTFMKDNPEKVQLSLEAKAVYEGQVGRNGSARQSHGVVLKQEAQEADRV